MNVQDALEKIGYKPAEARVYIATLQLGDVTVSDIAEHVRLPRSSTQVILRRLHTYGMVTYYTKRRYTYWSAESPKTLLANLQQKESTLLSALPGLMALREGKAERAPVVQFFKGAVEIERVYDDVLNAHQPICIITPWDVWVKGIGEEFFRKLQSLTEQDFFHVRFLTVRTALSMQYKKENALLHRQMRFLPKRIDIGDVTILYGKKSAIISINGRQPLGILMEDEAISNTKHIFFEELWRISSD